MREQKKQRDKANRMQVLFWKEGTILVHLLLLAGTEKRWELAHLSIKLLLLNIRGNPTFFTQLESLPREKGVYSSCRYRLFSH